MATVLVVDDAAFMRMMLKDILVESGHQVIAEAGTADEALQLYATLRPNLVTVDVVMPGKSGVVFVKEILARDPHARIVMVSSVDQQEIVEQALQAGAKAYLRKPFQPDQVKQCIEQILRS